MYTRIYNPESSSTRGNHASRLHRWAAPLPSSRRQIARESASWQHEQGESSPSQIIKIRSHGFHYKSFFLSNFSKISKLKFWRKKWNFFEVFYLRNKNGIFLNKFLISLNLTVFQIPSEARNIFMQSWRTSGTYEKFVNLTAEINQKTEYWSFLIGCLSP